MSDSTEDRIEKRIQLSASVSRVWRALTDYKEFGEWFGVDLESPFVRGQATQGRITHPGYEHLVMEVVVETIDPERSFSFRWQPTAVNPDVDYSADPTTLVQFDLEATAEGTRLTITESGFDALPEVRRQEAFLRNEGGWTQQLKNIENHVGTGA